MRWFAFLKVMSQPLWSDMFGWMSSLIYTEYIGKKMQIPNEIYTHFMQNLIICKNCNRCGIEKDFRKCDYCMFSSKRWCAYCCKYDPIKYINASICYYCFFNISAFVYICVITLFIYIWYSLIIIPYLIVSYLKGQFEADWWPHVQN